MYDIRLVRQMREEFIAFKVDSPTQRNATVSQSYLKVCTSAWDLMTRFLSTLTVHNSFFENYSKYLNSLRQTYSPGTVALYNRALLPFLLMKGLLTTIESRRLGKIYTQPRKRWSNDALSNEEVEQIINYFIVDAPDGYSSARSAIMVAIMSKVGLRIGQVLSITFPEGLRVEQDLNLSGDGRTFYFSARPSKVVDAELQPDLQVELLGMEVIGESYTFGELMDHFMSHRTSLGAGYLFCNAEDPKHAVSDGYVRRVFRRAGKKLGVKMNPHAFRHTAATNMVREHGVGVAGAVLNHSSLSMTQRYIDREALAGQRTRRLRYPSE